MAFDFNTGTFKFPSAGVGVDNPAPDSTNQVPYRPGQQPGAVQGASNIASMFDLGGKLVGAAQSYFSAKISHDLAKDMARIKNQRLAIRQNLAVWQANTQAIAQREAVLEATVDQQFQLLQAEGSARTAQATTGQMGGSADRIIQQYESKQAKLVQQTEAQIQSINTQRGMAIGNINLESSAQQASLAIQKPSAKLAILGGLKDTTSTFQQLKG